MELLMSEYKIDNIKEAAGLLFTEQVVLWVMHADRVPPHIGLSVNGKFYSLKANGKDEGVLLEQLLNVIIRKGVTTLGFVLESPIDIKKVESVFENYVATIPHQTTCLAPIKELFDADQVCKLTDLLDFLYQRDIIKNVYGYHTGNFSGIANYSLDDIHQRLHNLKND